MGRAHQSDFESLPQGAPCIIVSSQTNDSRFWWGVVVQKYYSKGQLRILARVKGGPGRFDRNGEPVRDESIGGNVPIRHYVVYPDNESTRSLLLKISGLAELITDLAAQYHLSDAAAMCFEG